MIPLQFREQKKFTFCYARERTNWMLRKDPALRQV